jgi:hypothetical protein
MVAKVLLIIGPVLLMAGCYHPSYDARLPYGYEYNSPYSSSYCCGTNCSRPCPANNCLKPRLQPRQPVYTYKPPPPYIGGCNPCSYNTCSY